MIILLTFGSALWAQPGNAKGRAATFADEGRAAMLRKEYASAADHFRNARQSDPRNMTYLVEEAKAWFFAEDYDEVIDILQGPMRRKKGKWEAKLTAYRLYGGAFDMQEKYNAARKIFRKGLREYPRSGELYLDL